MRLDGVLAQVLRRTPFVPWTAPEIGCAAGGGPGVPHAAGTCCAGPRWLAFGGLGVRLRSPAPTHRPVASAGRQERQLPLFSGCTLRQVLLPDSDVVELAGLRLTVPLRTALDVARTAPSELARSVLASMAELSGLGCAPDRIRAGLLTAMSVPGRRRGLLLLEDMAWGL